MSRYSRFLAIFLAFFVMVAFGQPAGATTPDQVSRSADQLRALGLIQGVDQDGNLALNAPITRAEMVTILVRAFGQADTASLLQTATVPFPDVAGHWASGNILLAKALGGAQPFGYEDGNFRPDGNLTAAEAVAFLVKFLGVKPDSNKTWPDDYLSAAVGAALITPEDLVAIKANLSEPATRGLAFYLMDSAFNSSKLIEGKTVYTTYVTYVKPPTVSIDDYPAVTSATQVTITGSVSREPIEVRVGSVAATLNGQHFTATVDLQTGGNILTVSALDNIGYTGTATVSIVRNVPEITSSILVSPRLTAPQLSCSVGEFYGGLTVDCTVTVLKADYLVAWVPNGQVVCASYVEACSKIAIVDDGEVDVEFELPYQTEAVINFMAFDDQGNVSKVVSRFFAIPE